MENLVLAYNNARKGKLHYREVIEMDKDPISKLNKLQNLLMNEKFKNSPYVVFNRKTGNKTREIFKLPFYPDRLIHHAIVQIMQPIWMNLFIRDTYSTIPKRGIHDGFKRLQRALRDRDNTQYCLKIDIHKYYPSIDHNVLKAILRRKIKDESLMNLLSIIIDSAKGIPIGNYISQWLGNLYLAYFDHYVKEELKIHYYFRYADDMVFLSSSKEHLWSIYTAIKRYLNDELKLQINTNYQVFPVDARSIDFLGYRFYHTHILVRKSIVKSFKKKIKNNTATKQTQSAYWGWFMHANTFNLTSKYFKNER